MKFSSMKAWIITSLAAASIGVCAVAASAEDRTDSFSNWSASTVGETSGIRKQETLPGFRTSGDSKNLRHRDFTGKPCLTVTGFARAETTDPDLYDDMIAAQNSCPQHIVIQVCYYQSEECIPMDVPGDEQREAVLGSLPSTQEFQFEFREKY
jgi:hypothetical protein